MIAVSTMKISLPQEMRRFLAEQIASGAYSDLSDYIGSLIRADQNRKARESIESLVEEGVKSGPPISVTPEYWSRKRRQLRTSQKRTVEAKKD
jgi:antitoxin ParD1/3/4